jgi:hypothetical protein
MLEQHRDKVLRLVKHDLDLIEKQARMLGELADSAPVLDKGALGQQQADFVVVHQQRMREIVRQIKSEVDHIRFSVEAVLGERVTPTAGSYD